MLPLSKAATVRGPSTVFTWAQPGNIDTVSGALNRFQSNLAFQNKITCKNTLVQDDAQRWCRTEANDATLCKEINDVNTEH